MSIFQICAKNVLAPFAYVLVITIIQSSLIKQLDLITNTYMSRAMKGVILGSHVGACIIKMIFISIKNIFKRA